MKKARILVQGIVQGVGFRPYIYRLAKSNHINGYVRNLGNIVEIIAEGKNQDINNFSKDIKRKKPPISKINSMEVEWITDNHEQLYEDFQIQESSANFSGSSVIPPDLAVCDSCLNEIFNNKDRRTSGYGLP